MSTQQDSSACETHAATSTLHSWTALSLPSPFLRRRRGLHPRPSADVTQGGLLSAPSGPMRSDRGCHQARERIGPRAGAYELESGRAS